MSIDAASRVQTFLGQLLKVTCTACWNPALPRAAAVWDEGTTTRTAMPGTMGVHRGDHDQGRARGPVPGHGGEGARTGRRPGDGGARGAESIAAAGWRRMYGLLQMRSQTMATSGSGFQASCAAA
mmetsp:Transcript_163015/g.297297  ORF Transcript_163015/g.297297 Transcript_163015/m.297297 type:complete len:125 (+) Transcript_163015:218-592(+)